jgi:multidrug efflux system membrane fusion protein
VTAVRTADVPLQLWAVGHVESVTTVSVRPRVGGEIREVHFREGDDVAEGALLFTLDTRPFESDLKAAEANLERDRARLVAARADASRYRELVGKDYVTRSQTDQVVAAADALEATVRSGEAAVETARLNLSWARIRAPFSGRTGGLLVHAGSVVKANDDRALVVLVETRPVRVSFTVPEKVLADVRRARAAGPVAVRATPPEKRDAPEAASSGTLEFIDNVIDSTTGTVVLKGLFPNADRALWPGESVEVSLTLGVERGALVVPSASVQPGQKGAIAWVVRPDGTVEARPVTVARSTDRWAVLSAGVKPGESVVTDGQIRLSPGARVEASPDEGYKAGPGAPGGRP